MIKILLFILMILWSQTSWATITLISNTCAASTGGTGVSVTTSAINTTGATLIVISVSYLQTTGVALPTDSAGNTWTGLTGQEVSGNTSNILFYKTNPTTSATQTFTENHSNNFPSICVFAFSGTLLSSPFDVQNGSHSTSTATLATGSVTPSLNNELLITGFGVSNAGSTMSINSGYTIPAGGQVAGAASNAYGTAMAYLVQGTASSSNPTWTNSASGDLASTIATFKSSASSSAILITGGTVKTGGTLKF